MLSTLANGNRLVVEGVAEATGRSLLDRARALRSGEGEIRRLCVWSASPADILTALALAELAGGEVFLAHRSLTAEQVWELAGQYGIDALWFDGDARLLRRPLTAIDADTGAIHLMTSGTTGLPKVARHSLPSLAASLRRTGNSAEARWLLTYPTTSFAGLQVVLAAVLGGGELYAPPDTTPPALVNELRRHAITHASGTPSLWRKLLLALNPENPIPSLKNITLGGEAVDQATLDRLSQAFPQARLRHVYASTEAGVIFTVADHRAGFPAS
ncbi:MAG: AMP-binding protein, partial [Bryobacterales bacterium]|nr:AMP-binding protein [Bryobacterales bacterium]